MFSIIPESNNILVMTRIEFSGPQITILDSKKEDSLTLMTWIEHTQIRFEYPQVIIIKGKIHYN